MHDCNLSLENKNGNIFQGKKGMDFLNFYKLVYLTNIKMYILEIFL